MSYKRKRDSEEISITLPLNEMIMLLVSAKLLNEFVEAIEVEYHDTQEIDISELVDKLLDSLPPEVDEMTTNMTEDILNSIYGAELNISDLENDNYSYPMYTIEEKVPVIKKAVRERRAIHIEYYSMAKEEVKKHNIYPYGMRKHGQFHLLVGHSTELSEIQVFRVDRIKSLAITDEKFKKPQDFNIESYLSKEYQ